MIITSDTSGIDALRRRIAKARNAVQPLIENAAAKSGETVSEWLGDASPHGRGGGPPPPGDAPGALAESFHVTEHHQSNEARIAVETKQPLKLQYVVMGTGVYIGKGRIVPTRKRALYWEGAKHPYRSVAGQKGNDIVSPVLARTDDAVEPEMGKAVEKLNKIMEG